MKEYECIKCNYKTVRKNNFDKHLTTENHNKLFHTEPSNELKIFKCLSCNYVSSYKCNYNRHLLNCKTEYSKTNDLSNNITGSATNDNLCDKSMEHEDIVKHKKMYECSVCHFTSQKSRNYDIHLKSNKHIQNMKISMNDNNDNNEKHMTLTNVEIFKNEVISTLMSQLSSVLEENNKNILAEQTKLLMDVKSITNNNNNNHNQTNNQQFNLNFFLNETCKDAMNLSDFLENMQVSMEDMEKTGEIGFAKGMSRIIMNNLNAIDVYKRPIHCSDVKRETLYVKNNGVWEKETEERKRTKEIIYKASRLNLKELLKWRDLPRNKGYEKSDHIKNDEFTNLVMEINKMREEEFDKIITSVSKHVAIDKEKVKMSGYLN